MQLPLMIGTISINTTKSLYPQLNSPQDSWSGSDLPKTTNQDAKKPTGFLSTIKSSINKIKLPKSSNEYDKKHDDEKNKADGGTQRDEVGNDEENEEWHGNGENKFDENTQCDDEEFRAEEENEESDFDDSQCSDENDEVEENGDEYSEGDESDCGDGNLYSCETIETLERTNDF